MGSKPIRRRSGPGRFLWMGSTAILCAGFLILAGCQLAGFSITPSQTPTASPTHSPTATASVTPSPWPSSTASYTPLPTLTDTPTQTPTATPTAQWCRSESVSLSLTPTSPAGMTPTPVGILRVTFLDRGNLWVWEEGGDSQELASGGDIADQTLSEDGQVIAYLRRVGKHQVELWAVDGDGQNPRMLVDAATFLSMRSDRRMIGVEPYGLTWLPDRHTLAFNTRPFFRDERTFIPDDLWTVNADNGYLSNLLPQGEGGAFSYAPNGRSIALMTASQLDLMDADGADRRPDILPGYQAIGMGTESYFPQLAWAPDSQSFKVALPDPDNATNPVPRVEIWQVPLPGFKEVLQQSLQAFPSSIQFSPDLLYIASWRWAMDGAGNENQDREVYLSSLATWGETPTPAPTTDSIYITDTPTPAPTAVDYLYSAGQPVEFLGWAPDSQTFGLWDAGQHRLYAGRLCESPVLLADGLSSLGVVYWQDSQTVLFVSEEEGAWQLRRGGAGQQSQILFTLGDTGDFDFALIQ